MLRHPRAPLARRGSVRGGRVGADRTVERSKKTVLNYQQEVSTRADVRALYEKVINDPTVESYRGFTVNHSYGWDPVADDYCKREGEVWFPNPSYDEMRALTAETAAEKPVEAEKTAALTAECAELRAVIEALQSELQEAETAAAKAAAERDAALDAWEKLRRALYALYRVAADGEKTA